MDRNLYIQGVKHVVPERIYLIHWMSGFNELKTLQEYNRFVRDYTMTREQFTDFYTLVTGNDFKRAGYYMYERLIERSLNSLDTLIWIAKYFELASSKISLDKLSSSYFDLMYDKYINYPNYTFSNKFRSIKTLLSFYKGLIDCYTYDSISCYYLIPISVINLQLSDSGLTEEDIRKDLNTQGLISRIDDNYYEWINKSALIWLESTKLIRIFELNQYKLFKSF